MGSLTCDKLVMGFPQISNVVTYYQSRRASERSDVRKINVNMKNIQLVLLISTLLVIILIPYVLIGAEP
jgi:hypothetical protein